MGIGCVAAVYYQYAPDRKAERAEALLRGCRGYLHADAYSGYKNIYKPYAVTCAVRLIEVACWAHARRYIYDAYVKTKSTRALELLQSIGDVHHRSRDQRPERGSATCLS